MAANVGKIEHGGWLPLVIAGAVYVTIDDLGFDDDNIAHVTARFGFKEQPNVPMALRLADEKGLECDADPVGYFGLPLERTVAMGSQIPL